MRPMSTLLASWPTRWLLDIGRSSRARPTAMQFRPRAAISTRTRRSEGSADQLLGALVDECALAKRPESAARGRANAIACGLDRVNSAASRPAGGRLRPTPGRLTASIVRRTRHNYVRRSNPIIRSRGTERRIALAAAAHRRLSRISAATASRLSLTQPHLPSCQLPARGGWRHPPRPGRANAVGKSPAPARRVGRMGGNRASRCGPGTASS